MPNFGIRTFSSYKNHKHSLWFLYEEKKVAVELQLHCDQGAQYASQAYFELTQTYGITPSMSRRGTPYNNAMAENFFSILKTECI